jgi:hypothetical protein
VIHVRRIFNGCANAGIASICTIDHGRLLDVMNRSAWRSARSIIPYHPNLPH